MIKSKKWAKSSDFYVNTHVLKSEAGDLWHSARAILNSILLCTQKRPALFKLCDNTPIIMSVFICNLDDDALRFYFPTGLERETGVLRQSYLSRPFLNTTQYHLYHQLFDLGMKTHTNARTSLNSTQHCYAEWELLCLK